jgi:hypothetical protein
MSKSCLKDRVARNLFLKYKTGNYNSLYLLVDLRIGLLETDQTD